LIPVRLTLVSASPRRRALLEKLCLPFDIFPSYASERWMAGNPHDLAIGNARRKVERSEYYPDSDRVLLGADTIIAVESCVFGKPVGRDSARRMLESLSNRWHEVITGIYIYGPNKETDSPGISVDAAASTRVRFRSLSKSDIRGYLDSREWEGKAGAYAIQDAGRELVKEWEGDFDNVVGLPTNLVHDTLIRQFSHCRFL